MRFKIIQFVFLVITITGYSQQDSQFTQYMYNTININPAYAASRGVMTVFTLHRAQWVGLEGSPSTSIVSLSTPIKGSNIGLGVSLVNDQIGPSDENKFETDISYTIRATEKFKVSFGLKASISFLNVNFSKLDQFNQGDFAFEDNIQNNFSPNVGAGLYLYSEKSYFGVSVPNILKTTYYNKYADAGSVSTATRRPHLYIMAGKVFELGGDVKLKPSILTKLIDGAPLQIDISGNVLFGEVFTLGLAYRLKAAVSAMAGFQVSDSWFIGYGYDMSTNDISNYSYGTHEVFLRFELFKRHSKIASPRFF